MNLKLSSFLVAAIALSLSAGYASVTHAAPLSVSGVQQYKLAQKPNGLNLTPAQITKMKQIRSDAQAQILALLNDTQKTQWQNAQTNHQKRDRQFWQSLNLDANQKAQIQKINHDAEQNVYNNVLTSDQQQKVDAMRSQRHSQPQQAPQ